VRLLCRLIGRCFRRRPPGRGPRPAGILAETRAWQREQPIRDADLPGATGVHAERRAADEIEGDDPRR